MWCLIVASALIVAAEGGILYNDPSPPPPPPPVTSAPIYPEVTTVAPYGGGQQPSYGGGQQPPSYGGQQSSYGGQQPSYGGQQYCKTYYETTYVDKCEPYTERVCYTMQHESCKDVDDENCNGIVSIVQDRKCFNVTELKCRLQEGVHYETVNAVFTVQKCHTVTERVCDTVYETEETSKDSFQCIEIVNNVCNDVDKTIYDKTCRTTTKFDCYGGDGGYGSGNDGAGAGYGSYSDNYCKRSEDTKCYNSPRIVSTEECTPQKQNFCQKLIDSVPVPKAKEVCHNEEKKVCELEQRTQPKQIKNYVYTTACKDMPRQVCDTIQHNKLVKKCVPVVRKNCSYYPVESCEDVPKEYCYKIPKKIAKQKCYAKGYGDDSDDGGSYDSSS